MHAGSRCENVVFFTARMPQSGKLTVLNLLTGQKSGFLPSSGHSLHRFTSNLAGPTCTAWLCKISPQSPQGVRIRPQKYNKNSTFQKFHCHLTQTLHGDTARRAHQRRCVRFLIQRIVFPTGCTEKFGPIERRTLSQ